MLAVALPEPLMTVLSIAVVVGIGVVALLWSGPATLKVVQSPRVFIVAALGLGFAAALVLAGLRLTPGSVAAWSVLVGAVGGFLATAAWVTWVDPPERR